MTDKKPTENRLAKESSAYLRSAGHQPVDWHPWGEEAFSLAREQNKPVLLDIGAVWCHWCHVMDGESYENDEIANLINSKFVAVKVDRDERPDIDRRYQNSVGAVAGQGGWPLTGFLTSDGQAFFGGTYFPPEDMHGRPGFKTVLTRISEIYAQERDKVQDNARMIVEHIEKLSAPSDSAFEITPQAVEDALQTMGKSFDIVNGGFGNAPKFPHTGAIELMLARYFETGEGWLEVTIEKTLEKMAQGGVYDQLGGGFHRYSVDEKWIVPHFEKMSYDNSELLKNYLHGYQAMGKDLFRKTAEGITAYVLEVGSDTEHGGFYASQDADIDLHDDGDYFTWTLDEVKEAVSLEEAQAIALRYNVEPRGEMHHNPAKNVLFVDQELPAIARTLDVDESEVEELLASGARKMLEARTARPTPFIDPTVYTGWNGMMASAFLEAHRVLGNSECRDQAIRTIELLLQEAYVPGRGFYHSLADGRAKIDGLLDDQVQMAQALLDAHESTGEARYLDIAVDVMDYVMESFWDADYGGFFDIPIDRNSSIGLEVSDKPIQDSPSPSSNSVAILVLDRLYQLTQDREYWDKSERSLRAFGERCSQYGIFAATYFIALDRHIAPPAHAVVVGPRQDERTQRLWRKALSTYRPKKLVSLHDPSVGNEENLPPALRAMLQRSEEPLAYVCAGNTCAMPTADVDQLESTLKSFGVAEPPRS